MTNKYGLSRPIQKLADHFNIDHSTMYRFADWVIHGRIPHDTINDHDRNIINTASQGTGMEYKEFLQLLIVRINTIYEDVKANA